MRRSTLDFCLGSPRCDVGLSPTPHTLRPTPQPPKADLVCVGNAIHRKHHGILHPTPYTLHPTPYTPHPTPNTRHPQHPTPYTQHPTPDTLLPIPNSLQPTALKSRPCMRRQRSPSKASRDPPRLVPSTPGYNRTLNLNRALTPWSCSSQQLNISPVQRSQQLNISTVKRRIMLPCRHP